MAERFEHNDRILSTIKFEDPTKVSIDISHDKVRLYVGPRDWEWDRKTGELTGAGTSIGRDFNPDTDLPKKIPT